MTYRNAMNICSSGFRGVTGSRHFHHALLENLEWDNIGEVYAGGVIHMGDIKGHPALDEARALGAVSNNAD